MEPRVLWEHQKKALAFALQQKNFALFHDMGTGKSGTAINILRHKFAEKGHVRKTLILSPLITLENWASEFKLFSRIRDTDITVLRGSGQKKFERFVLAVTDPSTGMMTRNRIIIANYEAMQNRELHKHILLWRPEILICDESHRVRNHAGKRARATCEIADKCMHKYILTGSPILNNAQDIFYQYRILDGGETFGTNFYAFRARYFTDKNAGFQGKKHYYPDWQERPEMYKELTEKMYFDSSRRPRAHRVTKKECLDLPPLVRVKIEVELGREQKKMYDEMKKEFITFVQDLEEKKEPLPVVANLAVTKAIRLQQITAGFVKADDGKQYTITDVPRLEALRDLLEDVSANKAIVWACFTQNYVDVAKVCNSLKLKYVLITGEQTIAEKELAMKEFRTNPEIKVCIANQSAAGIGVNLVEAPVSIFYSRNFSLEADLQAESRNYRGGSDMHERITRYDIIARGTIDEIVAEALEHKLNVGEQILKLK
jgi:SNF2 family DNA or RNA helicase